MGAEVNQLIYEVNDYALYHNKLIQELLALKQSIKEHSCKSHQHTFGIELEGWIVDKNSQPLKKNIEYLKQLNHKSVVNELTQYNIELNGSPLSLSGHLFSSTMNNTQNLWDTCKQQAHKMGFDLVNIGTLPTLTLNHVNKESISRNKRFNTINQRIFQNQHGQSMPIFIQGEDELNLKTSHLILAGAATSFQFHWKVPIKQAHTYYNASIMAMPAAIALSGNSPFIFNKNLWCESRIPYFEHCVSGSPRRSSTQDYRSGIGQRFFKNCISEYFVETLHNNKVILPKLYKEDLHQFKHLSLFNGTLWRWVRPIIGFSEDKSMHLRLEYRSLPAGPSMVDMVANMAFVIGLTEYLVKNNITQKFFNEFHLIKSNFYECAKHGLEARIVRADKNSTSIIKALEEFYIPSAKEGLLHLGFDPQEVEYYIDDVITGRVKTQQNGASWQRNYVKQNNCTLQDMTKQYMHLQDKKQPIYKWPN